jgi:hypothetical protein
MSSCNTSARRLSCATIVGALVAALLFAGGCKSIARTSDQPAPAAVAAPDASQPQGTLAPAGGSFSPTSPMLPQPPDAKSDAAVPAGDDDDSDGGLPEAADAGAFVPPEPKCVDNEWRLAPGFLPAIHVDYIADRDLRVADAGAGQPMSTQADLVVLSSAGEACANASDHARCESALALNPQLGRHLVTTSGDTVRIWPAPALRLLGEIDTSAEAVWTVLTSRGVVPCDAAVVREDGGTVITGLPNWSCTAFADGGIAQTASARVLPNGGIADVLTDAGMLLGDCPDAAAPTPSTMP